MDGIIAESFSPLATRRGVSCAGSERMVESGSQAPALQMQAKGGTGVPEKRKFVHVDGLVREFRKWQTEVLEEGTNKNVTDGPVRTAL